MEIVYKRNLLTCLSTVFLLMFLASWSLATNYYVNDGSSVGDIYCTAAATGNNGNTGTSSASPKLTLANLLSTYSGTFAFGDTIFVDFGTYFDTNLSSPPNGVVIQGAGMGNTVFINGCADCYFMYINDDNTVISHMTLQNYNDQTAGNGQALGIIGGTIGVGINYVQVFKSSTTSSGSEFPILVGSGAVVSFLGGGSICNNWDAGGGIHVVGSTTNVLINNYIFKGNYQLFASPSCAGLWVQNGNVTVKNSLFEDNLVDGSTNIGAALYVQGGNVEVTECLFDNNKSYLTFNSVGGTIYVGGGQLRLAKSIISNHTQTSVASTSYGAGIGVKGGVVIIDSCSFLSNQGSTTRGVDLYNDGGAITITDTELNSVSNQFGSKSGTINFLYSASPSNSGSYNVGVSFTNTSAQRFIVDLTGLVPQYTGTCASSINILPVEFIDFTGQCSDGGDAILNWVTASEKNNDFFTIENSRDGLNWMHVEEILSVGNTNDKSEYEFEMANRIGGYYRLSQTDIDGRRSMLKTIYIPSCINANGFQSAYYESAVNAISLLYKFNRNENVTLALISTSGQQIMMDELMIDYSRNEIKFTVPYDIMAGIYYLNVLGSDINKTFKIAIIQ